MPLILAEPSSFPTDILRQIFNLLDDKDLFSLLDVCRVTRTMSLVVLLIRYHSHIGWNEGVSLTSPVVQELQQNAMTIFKLNCQFDEIFSLTVLKKILSLLPHVEWLRVELSHSQQERNSASNRKGGGSMFPAIILRFLKSTRSIKRAGLVVLDPNGDFEGLGLPRLVTHRKIVDQIKRKMDDTSDYDSVHLQSFLRRSKWFSSKYTLLIPNHLHVTQLVIGHADFRGALATTVMPLLHLPALCALHIVRKARMNTADLFLFLSRHPIIEILILEHYSLARSDVMQDGGPWPLPNLKAIAAPLSYLHAILKDINLVRRLLFVTIGVSPLYEPITRRRLLPISDAFKFNEKFSFDTLDEVLCTLGESEIVSLDLVVPAGVASKEWLTVGENSDDRPERRLVHLTNVHVYPETDRGFPDSVTQLFRLWSERFPSVSCYSIHDQRQGW